MSGHSHWAKIKHWKIASDVAKGNAFDKLMRQIQFTAKEKGGDPNTNIALEQLMQKAKSIGLRKDKIELAIDKGLGKIPAPPMEHRLYEAFLSGVSFVIDALTDNDQRTANQLRTLLDRHHAALAPRNACLVNFKRVSGVSLVVPTEEEAFALAEKLNAIDYSWTAESADFIVPPETDCRSILAPTAYEAEYQWLPIYRIPVDSQAEKRIETLVKEIEERDDVQSVTTNHELQAAP